MDVVRSVVFALLILFNQFTEKKKTFTPYRPGSVYIEV